VCEKMTKNLNYYEVGESLVMRKKVAGTFNFPDLQCQFA